MCAVACTASAAGQRSLCCPLWCIYDFEHTFVCGLVSSAFVHVRCNTHAAGVLGVKKGCVDLPCCTHACIHLHCYTFACMQRLRPTLNPTGGAAFGGWSRMALQISSFSIIEVARPAVGEVKPASVTAELTYDLAHFNRMDVRDEWDQLKEHDVVFLLCLRPPGPTERADMEASGEDGVAATAGLRCAVLVSLGM